MKQTPINDYYNPDLLAMMPANAKSIVEVGCSGGTFAKAYKNINPNCHYTGIDVVPEYIEIAREHCDAVYCLDIENIDDGIFDALSKTECWVFGDALEHLKDPWSLLDKIRKTIPEEGGSIVACIPNAQHWSVQARLNCGMFVYEDSGLLDRTHLRWFTRITIFEMFSATGYKIVNGIPRIFQEAEHNRILEAIKAMAAAVGANPEQAVMDAAPLQYVVRAVPQVGTTDT